MALKKHMASRKFMLAAYGLVSSSLLAACGRLTAEYAAIVSTVMIAFSAADAFITGRTVGLPTRETEGK